MTTSEQDSLEIALSVGRAFGSVPSSISTVIRTLMHDHIKGAKSQRSSILFHTSRVFRAPTIKASFYYATQLFKPEKFEASTVFDAEGLIEIFGPDEIAAILALVYISRKAKTLADADEWKYIEPLIQLQANIGGIFGLAMPRIGLNPAMLISSLPCVALAAFQSKDAKTFKDYRRHLKSKNLVLDHAWEREHWGCDSMQVAAKLAQSLGFGVTTADMFTHTLALLTEDTQEVALDNLRLPVAYCWTCSLNSTGSAPTDLDEERLGELWPNAATTELLVERADFAKGATDYLNWLAKGQADISEQTTPKLFAQRAVLAPAEDVSSPAAPSQEQSAGLPPLTYESLIPELKAMISEEEFNSMSEVEKRQLVGDGTQH